MRTFVAGSKVVFVEDCAVRRGVIQSIYPNDNIAIVKLNNGETQKVPITRLGFDPSPIEQEEKEEPKKSEYKEEITITREDFVKKALKSTKPSEIRKMDKEKKLSTMDIMDLSITGIFIVSQIEKALFEVNGEDD